MAGRNKIGWCLAALLAGFASSAIAAEPTIVIKIERYDILGKTPREVFVSMNKRGPKYGFHSRAIAQTSSHVDWDRSLKYVNGACRVERAEPRATITFIYPRPPADISPQVKKRLNRFLAGIMRHERQHERYTHQMLVEAQKSVLGLKISGDKDCRRTLAEMKRRFKHIHDLYEEKQREFDVREHRDGANIDRLIKEFVND